MAGRIRSFKPELLDLEPAAALSSDAWRVWVSMMLLADDLGNLRAAPKLLAAHIFHDTGRVAMIEDALEELTRMPDACRVILYRSGGELFAHLNGFVDGKCQAIAQFPSKIAVKNPARVPGPDSAGAEPVSTIPRTSDTSRNRTEPRRTKKNQSIPKSSEQFREEPRARAHSPFPDPYPDPKHEDLPPNVVAAPPSFARVRATDDGGGSTRQDHQTHPEPPTARSVPAPERVATAPGQNSPAIASAPPAPAANPIATAIPILKPNFAAYPLPPLPPPGAPRPQYEVQRYRGDYLIDPRTNDKLILDLAVMTPEQVEAERQRCIAAMHPPEPAPPPTPKPQTPRADVSAPRQHTEKQGKTLRREAILDPPAPSVATPEDPESAMEEMLARAPAPISYLAKRSARRLASVLVGTACRATDIPPALMAAATKLDRKFERLTADSPEQELEELHRFVAGFVGKAHMYRPKASPAAAAAAPTEAGKRFLTAFCEAHEKRFGRPYLAAEDDPAHAESIVASLGQHLKLEMASKPDTDQTKARKRIAARLFGQWFGDRFGEQCGHSLRQLARLLATEPNRFHLGPESTAYGAASMAPDISPTPPPPALSSEHLARMQETISRVGALPATKEPPTCLPT